MKEKLENKEIKNVKIKKRVVIYFILIILVCICINIKGKQTITTSVLENNNITEKNEIEIFTDSMQDEETTNIVNNEKIIDKEITRTESTHRIENKNTSKTNNIDFGWELTLVNKDNTLPKDYKITLKSIDEYRKFDSRAIEYLNKMVNAARKDGVSNIWVQSSYRSISEQEKLFNNKAAKYKSEGKTQEEAEHLTELTINRPGQSEHNLGLAVDFNYVEHSFEETSAYKWLKKNAEDYGFILRYPKDKESITKVSCEPWHWRYVGKENAKKMNELGLCLEEYIKYLSEKEL